jgi:hypothetical protein
MEELIKPTIHLNGTSRADLLEQLSNARRALLAATNAMAVAQPNGRDYYPQGDQVIKKALDQHIARLHSVYAVIAEYEALMEHVTAEAKR